ncbi:hypothetical protein [Bordetella genomosp. 13]|uniref:hypothetical protein n=1 Tax=Bordetella genomosp. 13 TaxID=463040 RepID=UPI001642DD32|nr:hypothetical protein [Bordetella genomosp. 13]
MPAPDVSGSKRHALKIALAYLLIRGIPDLLLVLLDLLPPETFEALVRTHEAWLRHVYPIVPMQVLNVPQGFQQALALAPVLAIEVLLVFLFSARILRRRPWAAAGAGARGWIVFIAAALVWSFALRHQLLAYVQGLSFEGLRRLHEAADLDQMAPFLRREYWTLTAVIYASAPLWAWLPTWLHFRSARASAGAISNTVVPPVEPGVPALRRPTVFATFLLGCLGMHVALLQAVYMGLWPWMAELADVDLPMEALNGLSLPLALGQIGLAGLACAVAAHVYARRVEFADDGAFPMVLKPLLAGIGAYLLTSFVLLALAWLAAWASPGLVYSLPRQFAGDPQSALPWAVAVTIAAFVLLCLASGRMRASPRRWSAVLAVLALCAALPAYVAWTLARSNLGLAGSAPGMAVTGELGSARWRSMAQGCTGVVQTRHGTWLIARNEDALGSASYVPEGVQDLSRLVARDQQDDERQGYRGFGSRPELTTLARLQDDGSFKLVAAVPDSACMVVSPQSDTLFLLTDVERPQSSSLAREQTAVFRSADHGATWEWVQSGFLSEVDTFASNLAPTFASDQDVWAWGGEPTGEAAETVWGRPEPVTPRHAADGREIKPTGLFHSPDQGRTSRVVYSPEPLIAPNAYLRELVGDSMATFPNRRDMDQDRYVVQTSGERAYAWASEVIWHDAGKGSRRLTLTTRAELSRLGPEGEWQVTKVTRQAGTRIVQLSTSLDGRTYAVQEDEDGKWLVRLDTATGKWVERQRMPSLLPRWLAQDRTLARYFWSNGQYQVVSLWGDTVLPRWLAPFTKDRAEIDTDAHFYTRDGGRTWRQLAIPGYLGVMGLSPHDGKLYWNRGNWYSNDEPVQWEYDLAK